MEDVLAVYSRPRKQGVARLCMDERPCLLHSDVAVPLPLKAASSKRIDYEYKRQGTCVVFLAYDLDRGWRYCEVRQQKTKQDYACFVNKLIQQQYPAAKKVVLVQDNLNTHKKSSFYEYLPPERAGALARLLEFHYTPNHGSWLNMAEIEFSALSRQCLDRRLGSLEQMKREVQAWVKQRNKEAVKIHWGFTVQDARMKLKKHYPKGSSKN